MTVQRGIALERRLPNFSGLPLMGVLPCGVWVAIRAMLLNSPQVADRIHALTQVQGVDSLSGQVPVWARPEEVASSHDWHQSTCKNVRFSNDRKSRPVIRVEDMLHKPVAY